MVLAAAMALSPIPVGATVEVASEETQAEEIPAEEIQAEQPEQVAQSDQMENVLENTSGAVMPARSAFDFGDVSVLKKGKVPFGKASMIDRIKRYDLRDEGVITPVKNQDPYGTCWAFATIGLAESADLIHGSGEADYSEEHLAYFFFNRQGDPLGNSQGDQNILTDQELGYQDTGGNNVLAGESLTTWSGVTTEEDVPYAQTPEITKAYNANVVIDNFHLVDSSVEEMKYALYTQGPLAISYYDDGPYMNYDTYGYYDYVHEYGEVNHLVQIIGWDDNFSKEDFGDVTPEADGAWIVKNSWGTDWGDNGYFYMSYENRSIVNAMAADFIPRDTYQHNYFYDGTGGVETMHIAPGESIINVYEAKGDSDYESIEAVSLTDYSTMKSFEVSVFTDLQDPSDPFSGTLRTSTHVEKAYSGYDTIPLEESVVVPHGSYYAVVITAESMMEPGVEVGFADYDWVQLQGQIDKNQSYYYGADGLEDMADSDMCFRIQAMTNDYEYDNGIGIAQIMMDSELLELEIGEKVKLNVSALPTYTTDEMGEIIWDSWDPSIVTVDENGVVTAVGYGECMVIASVNELMTECFVIVSPANVFAEKISLTNQSITLEKGKTKTLQATVYPEDTSNPTVTYTSSNPKVVKVDANGKLQAVAYGSAKITVTAEDGSGVRAVCTVKVPYYTITYQLKGGTNANGNPKVYYKETVQLKNPSRGGYTFQGWYTDRQLKKQIKTITTSRKGNLTLYTKWKKIKLGQGKKPQIKALSKTKMKVSYGAVTGAQGYQIVYSTSFKYKTGAKRILLDGEAKTIKQLKKGKTYYVKVRAYKIDSTGKRIYGAYSKTTKLKL